MSNYTTLLGAEDVRAAGNAMRSAADQMQSAAMAFDTVFERQQRFMDDWLIRFTDVIEKGQSIPYGNPASGHHTSAIDADAKNAASPITTAAGDSIATRVRALITNHLADGEVTDTASLIDDLGADSLDLVEIVMAAEQEFGFEIPDEDAERILIVGDAIRYVEKRSAGGAVQCA